MTHQRLMTDATRELLEASASKTKACARLCLKNARSFLGALPSSLDRDELYREVEDLLELLEAKGTKLTHYRTELEYLVSQAQAINY